MDKDTTPNHTSIPDHDSPEIVVLNRDLFFGVRIGNALRDAGFRVTFRPATAPFVAYLQAADPAAALGLIDLGAGPDWPEITAFMGEATRTPILVFGPHTDVDGFRAAKAAGITRIVSNGDFHRDMLGLVRRYARGMGEAAAPARHPDSSLDGSSEIR